uniref:NAD-specific glutamate dehydrogenase n=1 Tax=Parastrongyloides trichosuri TaxID=131310 RepID=A0A0N5A026_PARTI
MAWAEPRRPDRKRQVERGLRSGVLRHCLPLPLTRLGRASCLLTCERGRAGRPALDHVLLAEQTEQNRARLVRDRQRLHTQLLLGLQSRQARAFLGQVGVHQVADADFKRVLHLAGEGQRPFQRLGHGAQRTQLAGEGLQRGVHGRSRSAGPKDCTAGRADRRGGSSSCLQREDIRGARAGLDRNGRRSGREQVDAVEVGAAQCLGDFIAQGIEVSQVGFLGVRTGDRGFDRDRQALLFFKSLGDGLARGQGHVDDRLTALHRLLHGIQGAHLGALVGGDGEDGAIVLGRRNLHASVHTVLRGREITARVVQVLQSNQGACGGQARAFLGQVSVHQVADADFKRVLHLAGEGQRPFQRLGLGAEAAENGRKGLDLGFDSRSRRVSPNLAAASSGDGRGRTRGLQDKLVRSRRTGFDLDVSRSGREQVDAVEVGAAQCLGDFIAQGVEVGQVGLLGVRTDDRRFDRDRQTLLFFKSLGDGLARGQGHVDDRLTALHRLLHGIQGAHLGALVGGDGEDGAIVLGRRHLLAGVHTVLRDREITARVVEVLQSNQGACVRIDAVSHFGFSFVFDISDAVLTPRAFCSGAQQHGAGLVRDAQRLNAELLFGLQRRQLGAFLGQIRVDQVADADLQRVLDLAGEGQRPLQRLGLGAQLAEFAGEGLQRRIDDGGGRAGAGHSTTGRRHRRCGRRRRLQGEDVAGRRAGLDRNSIRRRRREQVDAVEGGAGQSLGDFVAEGVEVGQVGLLSVRAGDRGFDRNRQALLFFQGLGDGLAGGQGHVDDRLTALDRLLHRVQSAHFGALVGGDGEDGAIVLGRRDLHAGVHAVLRDAEVAAGIVQVLQGNECAGSLTCPTPFWLPGAFCSGGGVIEGRGLTRPQFLAAEQAEQDRARLVRDAQRLNAELLFGLQGGQLGAFLGQISIDQVADADFDRVLDLAGEGQRAFQRLRLGAHGAQFAGEGRDRARDGRGEALHGRDVGGAGRGVVGNDQGGGAGRGRGGGGGRAALQHEVVVGARAGLDADGGVGGRGVGPQVDAVEGRAGQGLGDFSAQGVVVGDIGFQGVAGGVRDGDRQALLLFQRLDHGLAGGQGHVDDRLAALHGILDGVQGAHLGALIGGDREDRAVVLGRGNLQACIHAVLRDVEVTADLVNHVEGTANFAGSGVQAADFADPLGKKRPISQANPLSAPACAPPSSGPASPVRRPGPRPPAAAPRHRPRSGLHASDRPLPGPPDWVPLAASPAHKGLSPLQAGPDAAAQPSRSAASRHSADWPAGRSSAEPSAPPDRGPASGRSAPSSRPPRAGAARARPRPPRPAVRVREGGRNIGSCRSPDRRQPDHARRTRAAAARRRHPRPAAAAARAMEAARRTGITRARGCAPAAATAAARTRQRRHRRRLTAQARRRAPQTAGRPHVQHRTVAACAAAKGDVGRADPAARAAAARTEVSARRDRRAGPDAAAAAARTDRHRQRAGKAVDRPQRRDDAARSPTPSAVARGSRRAGRPRTAPAAAADADRLDPARPSRRGPASAGGQHRGFPPRRPLREPQPARRAIHGEGVAPGPAVSADLEPQVVVTDQAQLGSPAPATLEQQRQDVRRPLLVEGEAQIAVAAAAALQRAPQRLVQPRGEDVVGVRLGVHTQTGQVLQGRNRLDRPRQQRPDAGATHQHLLAVQHHGQQAVRRRNRQPAAGLGAHQTARRSPGPIRAGRARRQNIEGAVGGRGRLRHGRATDHRRLGSHVSAAVRPPDKAGPAARWRRRSSNDLQGLEDQSAQPRSPGALMGRSARQSREITGIGRPDCARGSASDTQRPRHAPPRSDRPEGRSAALLPRGRPLDLTVEGRDPPGGAGPAGRARRHRPGRAQPPRPPLDRPAGPVHRPGPGRDAGSDPDLRRSEAAARHDRGAWRHRPADPGRLAAMVATRRRSAPRRGADAHPLFRQPLGLEHRCGGHHPVHQRGEPRHHRAGRTGRCACGSVGPRAGGLSPPGAERPRGSAQRRRAGGHRLALSADRHRRPARRSGLGRRRGPDAARPRQHHRRPPDPALALPVSMGPDQSGHGAGRDSPRHDRPGHRGGRFQQRLQRPHRSSDSGRGRPDPRPRLARHLALGCAISRRHDHRPGLALARSGPAGAQAGPQDRLGPPPGHHQVHLGGRSALSPDRAEHWTAASPAPPRPHAPDHPAAGPTAAAPDHRLDPSSSRTASGLPVAAARAPRPLPDPSAAPPDADRARPAVSAVPWTPARPTVARRPRPRPRRPPPPPHRARRIVLADAAFGLADEDDPARHGVVEPLPRRVQNGAVRVGVEGVQSEIAPPGVLGPVGRKGHRGASPVGRDITAQGGDLERLALRNRRHRAVLDTCGHRPQACRLQRRDHRIRRQGRSDVDVVDGRADQGVTHAAADKPGAVQPARRRQRRHDRPRRRGRQPPSQREGLAAGSHQQLSVHRLGLLDQFIEDRSRDPRPQVGPHMDAWRRFAGHGVGLDHDGMVRPRLDHVADIRREAQNPIRRLHGHRPKRQVLDPDLQLLGGRDQMIAVRVLPQHRREQPHQFGAANGRAFMDPHAVGADQDVDVAAMLRMPQVHRRQAAPRRLPRGFGDARQARRCRGVRHMRTMGRVARQRKVGPPSGDRPHRTDRLNRAERQPHHPALIHWPGERSVRRGHEAEAREIRRIADQQHPVQRHRLGFFQTGAHQFGAQPAATAARVHGDRPQKHGPRLAHARFGEIRRAFLTEGHEGLHRFGAAHLRAEGLALTLHQTPQGFGVAHQGLGLADRVGRPRRQLVSQLARHSIDLIGGDRAVGDAPGQGRLAVDRLAQGEDFKGALMTDHRRQQQGRSRFRRQGQVDEGRRQQGVLGHHHHVAMQQQGQTDAHGPAAHRRYRRLVQIGQRLQEAEHPHLDQVAIALRAQGDEVGDVVAGGEGISFAAEQDHAHGVVHLGALGRLGQGRVHGLGDGVLLVRPIEDDLSTNRRPPHRGRVGPAPRGPDSSGERWPRRSPCSAPRRPPGAQTGPKRHRRPGTAPSASAPAVSALSHAPGSGPPAVSSRHRRARHATAGRTDRPAAAPSAPPATAAIRPGDRPPARSARRRRSRKCAAESDRPKASRRRSHATGRHALGNAPRRSLRASRRRRCATHRFRTDADRPRAWPPQPCRNRRIRSASARSARCSSPPRDRRSRLNPGPDGPHRRSASAPSHIPVATSAAARRSPRRGDRRRPGHHDPEPLARRGPDSVRSDAPSGQRPAQGRAGHARPYRRRPQRASPATSKGPCAGRSRCHQGRGRSRPRLGFGHLSGDRLEIHGLHRRTGQTVRDRLRHRPRLYPRRLHPAPGRGLRRPAQPGRSRPHSRPRRTALAGLHPARQPGRHGRDEGLRRRSRRRLHRRRNGGSRPDLGWRDRL